MLLKKRTADALNKRYPKILGRGISAQTLWASLILLYTSNCCYANASIDSVRNTVKEWVATEKSISAEAAHWQEKRILLGDLISVEKSSVESLEKEIEQFQDSLTASDALRQELLEERTALVKKRRIIASFLAEAEAGLQTLRDRLPELLATKLVPFYQRQPSNPEKTTLGLAERMQTVIGILTTVQKFDQGITVADELRALPDGTQAEVQTVYIGLGTAYYRTRSGSDAGYGKASDSGWTWVSQPELSKDISEIIAVAQNTAAEASFISLPVTLKN